jgi:hypothetical protein
MWIGTSTECEYAPHRKFTIKAVKNPPTCSTRRGKHETGGCTPVAIRPPAPPPKQHRGRCAVLCAVAPGVAHRSGPLGLAMARGTGHDSQVTAKSAASQSSHAAGTQAETATKTRRRRGGRGRRRSKCLPRSLKNVRREHHFRLSPGPCEATCQALANLKAGRVHRRCKSCGCASQRPVYCRGFESPAARRPLKPKNSASQHIGRTARRHICTPTTCPQKTRWVHPWCRSRCCASQRPVCAGGSNPRRHEGQSTIYLRQVNYFGRTVRRHSCTPPTYAQEKAHEDKIQRAQLGQPNEAATGKLEDYAGSCEPQVNAY